MNIKINFHFIVAVMSSFVLSSCASTQLSNVWRDPSFVPGPTKKTLVVSVRKDQLTRRAWEDGFAAAFLEQGVEATPSYHLFADTLPDMVLIKTVAKERNFDRIVLVERVFIRTEGNVTPGFYISAPEFPSQTQDGWYYTYYDRGYYPGYPIVDDIVKDEIKVWDTRQKPRLIWDGVGEAQVSGTREDVRDKIIQLIVSELVKQGVIASGS